MKRISTAWIATGAALLLSAGWSYGQAQISSATDSARKATVPIKRVVAKKPKPIANELSGGLRLNTNGWSLFAERGVVQTEETKYRDLFHNVNFVYLELSERKHPKETRTTISGDPQGTRPFIFGKINNFYNVRAGVGRRKMIAGKPEGGTVSVHWVYGGALALGMLKPYYVEALVANPNSGFFEQQTIKYNDETKATFLNENFIVGATGFSKGLNELKLVPGVQAKTGLHFDFAQRKRTKLAVEMGMSAEVYTKRIEIMANQKAVPYAMNIYASIQAGKRW